MAGVGLQRAHDDIRDGACRGGQSCLVPSAARRDAAVGENSVARERSLDMKSTIGILTILLPASCWAQLAGEWAGVAVDSQGAHRVVLHITGPLSAMKASADLPDQKI